jgi:ribonuclease BN (tRNA processing enzyme)
MRALESSIGTARHRHPAGPRRLTALLLAAGLTLAGAAAVAAGSGPGGPFYGAVVWLQTATLPSDTDARALERVRQIEERLLDAERAAASGDANAVAAALQAYREAVAEALAEVGTDSIHLARLEAALGHHVVVLEALSGHVPDAATNGIERAIEASQKAVDKLEASKPKPHATEPAAVPTAKPGKTDPPVTGPPTDRPDHTPRPTRHLGPRLPCRDAAALDACMRLTVVGAGPAYSDAAGAVGACYLVRSGDAAIALDLGHGAFAGLAARIPPEHLVTVAISHLHPDHFVDLVPLRHYLRYHVDPPARVRVDADPQLTSRLDALHAEIGWTAASLDVVPLEPGTRRAGPCTLEAARVSHTTDSFGFRVSDRTTGPGLVYSGDIGVADDLRPLIRPGDCLLVEASFGPGPVPPGAAHLDGPAVGSLAEATGVGRVLVTHVLMGRDLEDTVAAVAARFGGPVEVVAPGYDTEV